MSGINFDRLERDLEQAVEADRRYWEKNDAKFRAVHQRVATYEEFKEIVDASHLKPLQKGESVAEMKSNNAQWNRCGAAAAAGSAAAVKQPLDDSSSSTSAAQPMSCQHFVRHWRALSSEQDKYNFLISLQPESMAKLFAADIPFGLLGQFFCIYDQQFQLADAAVISNSLLALANCRRFSLAMQFCSSCEQLAVRQLVAKLQQQQQQQPQQQQQQQPSEQQLQQLADIYCTAAS